MSLLTTIYKFIKPELTDGPPDITVMNPNWDALDAELKRQDDNLIEHKAEKASQEALGHIKIGEGGSVDENGVYVPTGFKMGYFTRDISLASSEQIITGLGFKPRCILLHYCLRGGTFLGVGIRDGANQQTLITVNGNWEIQGTNYAIKWTDGAYKAYLGSIGFNDDGFKIVWTRSGEPTGTLLVSYLAFK